MCRKTKKKEEKKRKKKGIHRCDVGSFVRRRRVPCRACGGRVHQSTGVKLMMNVLPPDFNSQSKELGLLGEINRRTWVHPSWKSDGQTVACVVLK